MKLALTVLAAALLVPAAAACGGGDEGEEQGATVADPNTLEGSTWVLSGGIDVEGWQQAAPDVNFKRGQVGGSNGCNSFGGSYETDGSSLKVSEVFSTLIGCPPPADKVEAAFMASLEAASEWRIEDGELVLSGGENELRFAAASPEGSWRATSLLQGDAVTTLLPGTEITADFSSEGGISGTACNEYTASYLVRGSSISIEFGGATERLCADPQGVMAQADAFFSALPRAARFRIENGNLVLLTAKETILATFEPAG